ncbi:MAG TPA: RNA polymerase sigma factor [Gemmataceae bacterium]
MATSRMNGVLRHLQRAVIRRDGAGLTDGQLLDGFLVDREEAAFEALVRRHGPMVLGVCRRVLADPHDAEDAFQATFLVFVRKAASIAQRGLLANWLYGTAYRTALEARATRLRRQARERTVRVMPDQEAPSMNDSWEHVQPLLDRELERLPDKYRVPVILCDLEGKTRKEAARQLGWPEGTVSGRLARARTLLARRLGRHGLAFSGGALAVALSQNAASASMPASLVSSTVKAAACVAAGQAAAVSAPVAALTKGVLKAMLMTKLKIGTAVVLAVGLLGVGVGVGLYQSRAAALDEQKEIVKDPADGGGSAAGAPAKDDKKPEGDADDEEKINLPKGAAPVQVLASLDKDGKLVVKVALTSVQYSVPLAPGIGGGAPGARPVAPPAAAGAGGKGGGGAGGGGAGGPGGGIAAAPATAKTTTKLQSETFDLEDVTILDTKGKEIDRRSIPKLLKEETVVMASIWGQPIDPLHLRVLKEGTLTLVLPAPKQGGVGFGGIQGGGFGRGPGVPGAGGFGRGGFGPGAPGAAPAPATPAAPPGTGAAPPKP